MSGSQTIPIPAGLPVEWQQPEDAHLFWRRDVMHFPNPLTRIDELVARAIYRIGLNYAFAFYELPVRTDYRCFWTHLYWSTSPLVLPDDQLTAMEKRSEEKIGASMGRLMELWDTEWLPAIKEHLAFWEQFDLAGASTNTLIAHLNETLRRFEEVWKLHFEIVMPVQLPVSIFDEFYRDLVGSEDAFVAYRLIQGFDNLTLRAGSDLWKLSRVAAASPDVRTILVDQPVLMVIPFLETSQDGREFLSALRDYLDEHGRRGEIWGLSYPSWIEDPTPVITTLKDYLKSDRDPELELASLVAERDQLLSEARERLQAYPQPVRDQFEHLLKAAQDGNVLSEDHNYWIDFRACYAVRRVFLEFGRRFAEHGVIEAANDVVHLTADEIRDVAGRLGEQRLDRRQLVEERKAEIERYVAMELPPAVGTTPPGPPPVNPMVTMNAKFFGTPPHPSDDPNVLYGAAGSPGVVRGTARVIRSLSDANRLQPGEVLVAPTTAPSWTPLFATAAAVVTDTGGALSHCAVVAREYRIPAVVGTAVGTAKIRDGELIEVDGDRGVVRLVTGG